jgi:hypothetical protein
MTLLKAHLILKRYNNTGAWRQKLCHHLLDVVMEPLVR